jgi:hypothetical protein
MSRHRTDRELEMYSRGCLKSTTQLQRHLLECERCLLRLSEIEAPLMPKFDVQDAAPTLPARRALFIVHETADGMVYCRAENRSRGWFAHHWGGQLSGGEHCRTVGEANQHVSAAFRQMFPEHRCTRRCRLDPPLPARNG